MKIMANNQPAPRSPWTTKTSDKSPAQMDQFELQQEVWDSKHELASLRVKMQSGHSMALAGMSVLFTSLGVMVAQSALSGGLPGLQMIPLAVGAATGATLLSVGVIKRDNSEDKLYGARLHSDLLESIYKDRFPS